MNFSIPIRIIIITTYSLYFLSSRIVRSRSFVSSLVRSFVRSFVRSLVHSFVSFSVLSFVRSIVPYFVQLRVLIFIIQQQPLYIHHHVYAPSPHGSRKSPHESTENTWPHNSAVWRLWRVMFCFHRL